MFFAECDRVLRVPDIHTYTMNSAREEKRVSLSGQILKISDE
jgi:hypothetical protein